MNRRSKVASVLLCASVSSAFAGGSFVDGVYTINSTADETIGEAIPAAATNVVKTGAKQATLSKASTFAGTVEVNNGILRTTASSYLGSPSAFTLSGNTSQLWFEGASCTFAGWPAAGTVTLQSPNNNFPYLTFKSVPATSPFPFGIHAKKSASATVTSFVVEDGGTDGFTVGMNAVKGPITIDAGAQLRNWTKSYMQSMFTGAIDSQGTLYKSGQGTLWLTGNVSRVTCKLNVGRGDLVLENAGLFSVTGDHAKVDYSQTIEANLDGFARIAVKSGSTYAVVSTPKTVLKSTVGADANTYGVLQVYDGGVITNAMTLGNSGSGALRQFGGKVYWLDNAKTSNESVGYGSTGYGCYWMSNGTMQCGTDVGVSFGPKGVGYFIQKGGTAKFDYSTYLSKDGGYGEIYTRGDLRDKNTLYIGNDCPDTTDKGCSGVITLDGPDAYTSWHAIVHACQKSDRYVTSFLNVRDGAKCAAGFVGREGDPATFTGKFFVNVNGGTMVSTVTSKETWHNDSGIRFAPDRLTVYERGVTFDVDAAGKVRVWDSPIVKPTGKGIASITLPSDVTDKKYWLGPAKLTITSTSGTGATAICDYEPIDHAGSATSTTGKQFGQQKGVIITSPGWDYEEGTVTCTAHHQNHSFMTTWPCTVTLADNVQTCRHQDGRRHPASHVDGERLHRPDGRQGRCDRLPERDVSRGVRAGAGRWRRDLHQLHVGGVAREGRRLRHGQGRCHRHGRVPRHLCGPLWREGSVRLHGQSDVRSGCRTGRDRSGESRDLSREQAPDVCDGDADGRLPDVLDQGLFRFRPGQRVAVRASAWLAVCRSVGEGCFG